MSLMLGSKVATAMGRTRVGGVVRPKAVSGDDGVALRLWGLELVYPGCGPPAEVGGGVMAVGARLGKWRQVGWEGFHPCGTVVGGSTDGWLPPAERWSGLAVVHVECGLCLVNITERWKGLQVFMGPGTWRMGVGLPGTRCADGCTRGLGNDGTGSLG